MSRRAGPRSPDRHLAGRRALSVAIPSEARGGRSEGAGSLMVIGVVLCLAVLAWAIVGAALYLTAQHRVRTAADLAALAGAQAALDSGLPADVDRVACDAVQATAASYEARVDDCQVVAFGSFVGVQTTVSVTPPFAAPGFPARLEAVARAGNASDG